MHSFVSLELISFMVENCDIEASDALTAWKNIRVGVLHHADRKCVSSSVLWCWHKQEKWLYTLLTWVPVPELLEVLHCKGDQICGGCFGLILPFSPSPLTSLLLCRRSTFCRERERQNEQQTHGFQSLDHLQEERHLIFYCHIFSLGVQNGLLPLSLPFNTRLTVQVWREVTARLCKSWEGVGVNSLSIGGTQEMRHCILLVLKKYN